MASSSSPSSELPEILNQYQRYLHRLDALEQRLEESIASKRQRASSLLEILPTHRSSHLRLFVTHHVDEGCRHDLGPKERWTLVLEGKLLVGYLDHENAMIADQEPATSSPENTLSTPVSMTATPGAEGNNSSAVGTMGSNRLSRDFSNRGFCDNDFEEPPPMIRFSHFFDKVSVSFQAFYRDLPRGIESAQNTLADEGIQGLKMKRIVKELSSSGSKRKSMEMSEHAPFVTSGSISTLKWERETNPSMTAPNNTSSQDDAQAFHVVYDDIPRDKETVLVATIHLYKRMGPKERYRPSEALSQVLFPPCAPKNAEDDKKKKKGMPKSKISLSMDELTSPKKKLRTQPKMNSALDSSSVSQSVLPFSATNLSDYDGPGNLGTSAGDNQGAPTVPRYATIPMENSIQIPTLLTMEEIMGALFRYIKDRDLWDIADASLINNNQPLVSLFDCQSMTLAQMKGMLLSRKLIEKVGSFDHPIVLTYVIRRDTGMPRINDQLYAAVPVSLESTQSFTVQSVYQNKLVDDAITGTMENPLKSIVGPYPNYLTFDMDIDVPMLFPFRTREILGRIKRREFEWTNARTKALRMVQASRVEEELIKEKLEDIVKGRGLSKEHIPILLALAKTSSTGSQAQVCAHIDARIAFLMQRLEYHVGLAKACWGVVDGLSNI